jgi:hypothetical protein
MKAKSRKTKAERPKQKAESLAIFENWKLELENFKLTIG